MRAINSLYPASDIKVTDLPITHVYGTLGSLDDKSPSYRGYAPLEYLYVHDRYNSSNTIPYKKTPDSHNASLFEELDKWIFDLAMEIATYGTSYEIEKASKIQGLVINAKDVYFLGFSFQKQNMNILFDESSVSTAKQKFGCVGGTCFDMPIEKMHDIRNKLQNNFPVVSKDFLTENWRLKRVDDYFKNYSIKIHE